MVDHGVTAEPGRPDYVNVALAVTVGGCCGGTHYLIKNPHTFRGRISTYCPADGVGVNISKRDVVWATGLAWA